MGQNVEETAKVVRSRVYRLGTLSLAFRQYDKLHVAENK